MTDDGEREVQPSPDGDLVNDAADEIAALKARVAELEHEIAQLRSARGVSAPDTPDLTHERIGHNESRFREANDRIEVTADDMHLVGPVPFICECAVQSCMEIVRLPLEAYESVRRDSRLFFCTPGHEGLAVQAGAGVVVAGYAEYVLVQKTGVAGEVAAEEYERANNPPSLDT